MEQVRLLDRFSNKSTHGTLYLTATHLIFVESGSNNTAAGAQEIWVSTWLRPAAYSAPLFDRFYLLQTIYLLQMQTPGLRATDITVKMHVLHNLAVAAFSCIAQKA